MDSWRDEVAPTYFDCKSRGLGDDDAAAYCREKFPGLIGDFALNSISRGMRKWRQDVTDCSGEGFRVPPPLETGQPSPLIGLEVPYQDCHIWNDTHIPFHIPELMDLSLERASASGVRCLVIGGDFMDMGWASKYVSWGTQGPTQTAEEFLVARGILREALRVFDTIYIIPGNHDGTRFKYMSNGTLGFRQLMDMVLGGEVKPDAGKRIVIGERRWMVLKDSPWGDWRITHPVSARSAPLSLAQVLAHKYRQNIITAHQHYLGVSFDRYGQYVICDGGHMQDESLTEYKLEVDSTHSSWAPGYVELIGGWPTLVPLPRGA